MPQAAKTKKIATPKNKETVSVKKAASVSFDLVVYDLSGGKKTPVKISQEVFGKKISEKLLAQYVRVYLANQRQGTISTKTRADVVASKHKIYRQKGTGKARHGAKSAPIFVGGGIAFGPKPRDFTLQLNKKQKKSALFGALTLAFQKENVLGLSDSALEIKPKTKEVSTFIKKLNLEKKRVLFVLPKLEKNNLVLASRNLPNVELTDARSLNTYSVLKQEKIIFLKSALPVLETHFLNKNEN